jgi:hypothetical protein
VIGIVMPPGALSGGMPGSIMVLNRQKGSNMLAFFFFVLGFALGWYFRGTRAATWVYDLFKPDADAVKKTKE